MTLSPEERAAKIVADYYASDLDVINGAEGEKRTIESLIATAIRQACNEKLEEAAATAERAHLGMSCFVDAVDCGQFNSGVRHAAKAVRALIDPPPPTPKEKA